MTYRLGRHTSAGGLWIIDLEVSRIKACITIPRGWSEDDITNWLGYQWGSDLPYYLPELPADDPQFFVFKDQIYFSMGVTEEGLKMIRSIRNPFEDSHDTDAQMFCGGEEESDESDS